MIQRFVFAAVFFLGFIFAAVQIQTTAKVDAAYLRFAHAAVDVAPADFYVEEQISAVQALAFSDTSDWFEIVPGTYTVLPASTGRIPKQFYTTAIKLAISNGDRVTIVLVGSEERESLTLYPVFQDTHELPPGEARLGVFHAVESLGAVDVLANGSALFQYVNFPATARDLVGSMNDGFATVDVVANTYEIEVVPFLNRDNVLLDLGEIQLLPGHHYWVALMGASPPLTFSLAVTDIGERNAVRDDLFVEQVSQDAEGHLRIAHFSSGTPSLDVFIDQERIVEGLSFAEVSEFVLLPAGTYQLALVPSGLNVRDALIPPIEIDLDAERWLTTAVIGTLANDSLAAQVVVEDFSPLPESQVRVSVFQAIPGIPPVNVQLDDGAVVIRLLGYPGSQGNNDGFEVFNLAASTYDLEVVNAAATREVIVSLENQLLLGGRNYLLATIRAEPPYVLMFTEVEAE